MVEDLNSGPLRNKSRWWSERDSYPGPPDCESDALTTRLACPRSKSYNKPTYGTGTESNPEHIGGRRALSGLTALSLLPTLHVMEICIIRSRISGLDQRRSKKLKTAVDLSHSYHLWSHLWCSIYIITITAICSVILFLKTPYKNIN